VICGGTYRRTCRTTKYNGCQKDPDEKLREYLRTLSPNFSEEELEIALWNLKQYFLLAGEVASESLRKEKENKSE